MCGTAFGAVESGVVGYQNKEAENASGYTWMASTFQNVDGSTVTLGDFIILENLAPTAAKLYLLSKSGATLVDSDGNKCVYVYLNETRAAQKTGLVAGWYRDGTSSAAMTGDTSTGWANEVEIPYGQGFGLYRTTTSATLVFSGAVASEDAELEAVNASGYTWMGNVMPVEMTLSDFIIKENLAPTAVKLYLLSKSGSTLVDGDGNKCVYVYLNATRAAQKAGLVAGWYRDGTSSSAMTGETSAGWANNVTIAPGQGFGVYRTTTSATLVVPSPLAD